VSTGRGWAGPNKKAAAAAITQAQEHELGWAKSAYFRMCKKY
jgi:hypothetical protein